MPMVKEREYRMAGIPAAVLSDKRINTDYYIEGIAARYEKYPLFDFGDGDIIYERFERGCFDNADMSDVIFQYDHSGKVYARQSNGSLIVEPCEEGLFMAADLSRTAGARDLYGDISAKMITKMSWAFMPGEWGKDCVFDEEENCIVHKSVRKIYDVSAVSIPANNDTSIYTRDGIDSDGAIRSKAEEFRAAKLEIQRRKLFLMTI